MLCAGSTVDDSEEPIISKRIAHALLAQWEFAFVGIELDPKNETPYVIVDGRATTTLTSSFENCTDIKPKKVNMIGKSTLESYPERRSRADHPLKQVNVNSFSSSVQSIEEYKHWHSGTQ